MSRHGNCRVSIVIPVFNQVTYTLTCLAAVAAHADPRVRHEVIVVDNGSTDGTREALAALGDQVHVITNPRNLGFACACNQGARAARGEFLLFLNNDTEVQRGWLWEMLRVAESDPRVGIVGSKLLFPDGRVQHAGVVVSTGWAICHLYYGQDAAAQPYLNRPRDFRAVTGACLLLRRGIVDEECVFDEAFVNGYEDVDLCFRVREAGHRVVYCPASVAVHHEGATEGRNAGTWQNLARLRERWEHRVPEDEADYFLQDGFYPVPAEGEGVWRWCGFDPAVLRTGAGGPPALSVVIVARDEAAGLARAIRDVGSHTALPHEIVVVDDGSQDATAALVQVFARRPGFRLLRNAAPAGAAASLRRGLAEAGAEKIVLLHPAAALFPGWDRELLRQPAGGAARTLARICPVLAREEIAEIPGVLSRAGDSVAAALEALASRPLAAAEPRA